MRNFFYEIPKTQNGKDNLLSFSNIFWVTSVCECVFIIINVNDYMRHR
jgi:hypothetical protein